MHLFRSYYHLDKVVLPILLSVSMLFGWQACAVSGSGKTRLERDERCLIIAINDDPNPYGWNAAGSMITPFTALDVTSLQWTLAQELKGLELFETVTRYDEPLSLFLQPAYELRMYGAWFARDAEKSRWTASFIDAPIPEKVARTSRREIPTRRGLMGRYELKDLRTDEVLETWYSFSEASFSATLPEIAETFLEEEHRQILTRTAGRTVGRIALEKTAQLTEKTEEQTVIANDKKIAPEIREETPTPLTEKPESEEEQAVIQIDPIDEKIAPETKEEPLAERTEKSETQETPLAQLTDKPESEEEQAFIHRDPIDEKIAPETEEEPLAERTEKIKPKEQTVADDDLKTAPAQPEIEGRSTHQSERALAQFASQTELRNSPFYAYFGTVDTSYIRTQLRDFPSQLTIDLAQQLSQSAMRHFPWSDHYKLTFDIVALDFEIMAFNAAQESEIAANWRQSAVTAQIRFQLFHLTEKRVLFTQRFPLTIQVKKYTYGGKQTLASLSKAAAQRITQILEGHLPEE